MELTCKDEKMRQILLNMGVASTDEEAHEILADESKRKRITSVIETLGGLEKVSQVTEKRKLSISAPVEGSFTKNTGCSDLSCKIAYPLKFSKIKNCFFLNVKI